MATTTVNAVTSRPLAGADKRLGLGALIAIVVGSMVGGGVFALPQNLASGAGAGAVLIGWLITGVGIVALALVYQNLALRRPDLDGGVYSYAKAGFGDFVGFNSAWGYWLSVWLGNVSYAVLLFGALSYFLPVLGGGNSVVSVAGASAVVWTLHLLILRGVREAALVNLLTTVAKLVPILIFLIAATLAFNLPTFQFDFWGRGGGLGSLFDQVKSTMLVTLWVFIGVEGAVVISGRAAKRGDVGKATVVGLVGVLAIYVLISLLSLGVLSRPELAGLDNPSMAYVLEAAVGGWGAALINLGLCVSLFGAWLGWTLLAAEIPFVAAKDGTLPRLFAAQNKRGSPAASLWITNGLVQLFLLITLFAQSTYEALYFTASTAILIPYILSGAYAWKLARSGDTYRDNPRGRRKDLALSALATLYGVWLVYAAGPSYLLLCAILYAAGIVFFWRARREQGGPVFVGREPLLALGLVIAAVVAAVLWANGTISPL